MSRPNSTVIMRAFDVNFLQSRARRPIRHAEGQARSRPTAYLGAQLDDSFRFRSSSKYSLSDPYRLASSLSLRSRCRWHSSRSWISRYISTNFSLGSIRSRLPNSLSKAALHFRISVLSGGPLMMALASMFREFPEPVRFDEPIMQVVILFRRSYHTNRTSDGTMAHPPCSG